MSDRDAFREAREHGLQKRHEQRLEHATYTAAEVKVLTETAAEAGRRIGRKEAADKIADEMARGYDEMLALLRDLARPSSAASDAISGVPRHSEVSEAPKAPQEPDACWNKVDHP